MATRKDQKNNNSNNSKGDGAIRILLGQRARLEGIAKHDPKFGAGLGGYIAAADAALKAFKDRGWVREAWDAIRLGDRLELGHKIQQVGRAMAAFERQWPKRDLTKASQLLAEAQAPVETVGPDGKALEPRKIGDEVRARLSVARDALSAVNKAFDLAKAADADERAARLAQIEAEVAAYQNGHRRNGNGHRGKGRKAYHNPAAERTLATRG